MRRGDWKREDVCRDQVIMVFAGVPDIDLPRYLAMTRRVLFLPAEKRIRMFVIRC